MAIEALEGLTDEQLFNDANADEAPNDEISADAVKDGKLVDLEPSASEQTEQARDEATGRWAAKPEAEPETVAVAEPPAKAPVDDNAAMVPSWRVREINEEKRTLADRLAALEADKANWQRQQQPPKPVEPEAKAPQPDPLLDPEGYATFIERRIEARILNERAEDSLQLAHRTYKAEFEEAYAAAQKQIDPVLKARMQQSRNPGETLMEWHREQKTRAEVGNDANAYFDKRLEAFLTDPANQAKVLERIRGGIQPAGNGKPAPTNLPPSLTRATNAATAHAADDDDLSNDGLWRHANA